MFQRENGFWAVVRYSGLSTLCSAGHRVKRLRRGGCEVTSRAWSWAPSSAGPGAQEMVLAIPQCSLRCYTRGHLQPAHRAGREPRVTPVAPAPPGSHPQPWNHYLSAPHTFVCIGAPSWVLATALSQGPSTAASPEEPAHGHGLVERR